MAESPFKGVDYERMILANMEPNLWYERKQVIKMIEALGVLRDVDRKQAGETVDHMYVQRIGNALYRMKEIGKLETKNYPDSDKKLLYSLKE
jgi:hypothetical protein